MHYNKSYTIALKACERDAIQWCLVYSALPCHSSHVLLNGVEYAVAFIVIIVYVVFIRDICRCSCRLKLKTMLDERAGAAQELDVTTTKSIGNRISYDTKNFYQM